MSEFKSQAECWQALLDGRVLINTSSNDEYKMVGGQLVSKTGWGIWRASICDFSSYQYWKLKKQTVKKNRTAWVNVYENEVGIFDSEHVANYITDKLACIKIELEWEEEVKDRIPPMRGSKATAEELEGLPEE